MRAASKVPRLDFADMPSLVVPVRVYPEEVASVEENAMPDSRPRPPLLAWDGIVIANADFAAMVAAAVNATSAERREADSLSAAATVALRRARRARAGAAARRAVV